MIPLQSKKNAHRSTAPNRQRLLIEKGPIMKRIVVVAVAILFATGFSASAQDQSRRALAEELMTLLKVQENMEKSLTLMKQMVTAQIEQLKPLAGKSSVPPEVSGQMNKMIDLVGQELSWDKLKDEYVSLYADLFTDGELKDMIAFYQTPSGQAFVNKQPELVKRSMDISQKMLTQVIPKIQAMAQELQESLQKSPLPQPDRK